MDKNRYFLHFKGGLYQMLGIALHSETLEKMVVYQALYGEKQIWIRPFSMFFDIVICDNQKIDRFKEISEEEMLCLLQKKKEST